MIRKTLSRTLLAGTASTLAALVIGAATASADPLPLKICHIDDRSGSAADTGIEGLNGLKMVLDPLNKAGGINGRQIELITYDQVNLSS